MGTKEPVVPMVHYQGGIGTPQKIEAEDTKVSLLVNTF